MEAGHAAVASVSEAPTIASLWREITGREMSEADLTWPADVFALVGTVLQRTHAYRFSVSPPSGRSWPPGGATGWNAAVCRAGEQWCAWAEAPDGPPPPLVADTWQVLRESASVPLDDVSDGSDWPVCQALIAALAMSDEACAGVGGVLDPVRAAGHRFRARSAELLARTGSLSRISTYRLRVLPKVRTPPGGISFRSLSRYLALRGPSVGVAWHSVPARREGTAQQQHNVLLLPWPLRVRQRDFRPLPNSVRRSENEPFGTFEFVPAEPFDLDLVERVVQGALDEAGTVDAVVLPESAVPSDDLDALEALLGRHGVTLLVAGVRESGHGPDRLPANWVHLGVRLAGAWWHYRQNKHHRWFLDESQIDQYDLAGALHPSVRWWEAMEVPGRSVQILELGNGMTLVAVVCEDLARLDEVAELLRDVGPALVLTLLLDGPQLASRWTARYASVLADDPGSAVLTLTAYGMVERSRPGGLPPSPVVALWKDPSRGLRQIALEPGTEGVLVSVAVTSARRRAAEGRTPLDNSTGLVVAGVRSVRALPQAAAPPGPEGAPEEPALDTDELSLLTGWAYAVAEALDHAPSEADEVGTDALPGAPWRRQFGLPEPSAALGRALEVLTATVQSVGDGRGAGAGATQALAVLAATGPDADPAAAVGATVLRAALHARHDRGTTPPRH